MTPKLTALFKRLLSLVLQRGRGVGFAIIVPALIGFFLLNARPGEKLRHWSYDLPFLLRGSIRPTEAVMVYLDEASHTVLDQPYDKPWPRQLHAQLLDRLTREKAKVVVFDILFLDPGDPEIDKQFANAVSNNANVVLCADVVRTGYGNTAADQAGMSMQKIDAPYDLFYQAASGRIAFDTTYPDSDGSIRLYSNTNTAVQIASEAWEAAKLAGAPITTNSQFSEVPFYLNYYGPSTTIPSISYYKAITNDADVPAGFFRDKVVFVGARTQTKFWHERKDEYPTPFSAADPDVPFSAGAEIHAAATLNLLRHEWLTRFSPRTEEIITVLLGGMIGFILVLCRSLRATLLAVLFALGITAVNFSLFVYWHRWFPWLIPVIVQIPLALVWSLAINSVQLYVQNRLLEQSLAKYVSKKRVKQLRSRPEFLKPGAEKQTLTILFSDIENFTTISEGMDSDELAKLMNRYFESAVSGCIHKTDGTVVKYIGDAIFSFWNAPEQQQNHAERACEAALLLRKQDVAYQKDGRTMLLRTRIGLHTGEANVGNFGSEERIDYTAIGENINLASRLEGLNKYLGTDVLISEDTKKELGDRFITRRLGQFRLKGFERIVEVFELVSLRDKETETKPWRDAFANALQLFEAKKFDEAKTTFCYVLQLRNDGPSKFYLRQIEHLIAHAPAPGWKGEVELQEK